MPNTTLGEAVPKRSYAAGFTASLQTLRVSEAFALGIRSVQVPNAKSKPPFLFEGFNQL